MKLKGMVYKWPSPVGSVSHGHKKSPGKRKVKIFFLIALESVTLINSMKRLCAIDSESKVPSPSCREITFQCNANYISKAVFE